MNAKKLEISAAAAASIGLLALASLVAVAGTKLSARRGAALSVAAALGALAAAAGLQAALGLMAPAAAALAAVFCGYAAAQVAAHPAFSPFRHAVAAVWSGIDMHHDLAAQDAQHVVLRAGQPVLAHQPLRPHQQ